MKLYHQLFDIASWTTEPVLAARITLRPECIIYQAHFPGRPITPGVCIIGIITELLELRQNRALQLSEVKNLKFIDVIEPTKVKAVTVTFDRIEHADDGLKVRGTLVDGDHVYTKYSLIYQ